MDARGPPSIATCAYLFLCFVGVLARNPLPSCPSSSCGDLQDIRYPFRLSTDLEPCGMPEYELVCEGNKTVLNWGSGKYYVHNISYRGGDGGVIHVVDVSLASGSCSLPSQSVSPRSPRTDTRYNFITVNWAAFVNCSRMIDDKMYQPVPCMSRNGSHVHLVHGCGAYHIQFLQPSCHALSLIPLTDGADEALTSGEDVKQVLQMGFQMQWTERIGRISKAQIAGVCWSYTFELFFQHIREGKFLWSHLELEKNLYDCLQSNIFWWRIRPRIGSKVDIGYTLVMTILLSALHLIIVLTLVGRFVVAPSSNFVLLIRKFQEERAFIDIVEKFLQNQRMLTPARYTYPEIIIITNRFEKKVGQGGFGSVFQGKLPGGHLVAVKMLNDTKCNGEDFMNEVSTIGRIHHVNVMQLIGFCSEGNRRALIYEYMPNGSLDKYIFASRGATSSLSWERLRDIAVGAARGVEYLHRGCDVCILHFDIKPHNILLDHNFTPKVSDFGLAKMYPRDNSLVSVSAARGTIGYIAPELISRNFGAISYKSDVYSFGMLLLEMAGDRKSMDLVVESSSEKYFPAWIYDRLCDERVLEQDGVAELSEVERKLCIVGLWCIQMNPLDRPSMSSVIEMLEGSTDALQMPPKPFFSSPCSMSYMTLCLDTSTEELSIISEV